MKKTAKLVAALLVLAMMVTMFAACGSKDVKLKILDTEYVTENYAIAIAKDNEELLNKVNDSLAKLKADGTLQSIIDKYIKAE